MIFVIIYVMYNHTKSSGDSCTLKEEATVVFLDGRRERQPHDGVGTLLGSAQALLHLPVEVWHRLLHR